VSRLNNLLRDFVNSKPRLNTIIGYLSLIFFTKKKTVVCDKNPKQTHHLVLFRPKLASRQARHYLRFIYCYRENAKFRKLEASKRDRYEISPVRCRQFFHILTVSWKQCNGGCGHHPRRCSFACVHTHYAPKRRAYALRRNSTKLICNNCGAEFRCRSRNRIVTY
jgi:hypothetical protein